MIRIDGGELKKLKLTRNGWCLRLGLQLAASLCFLFTLGCVEGAVAGPDDSTNVDGGGGDAVSSQPLGSQGGQLEVAVSPTTVLTTGNRELELVGVRAIDGISGVTLNGQEIVDNLPSGAVIELESDGTGRLEYSDDYDIHYRYRTPCFNEGESYGENLQPLNEACTTPRILDDLYAQETEFIGITTENTVWWSGSITYRFSPGHPITAAKLTSADGEYETFAASNAGLTIEASTDGEQWTVVAQLEATNPDEGMGDAISNAIPAAALGGDSLYLRLSGQECMLRNLNISAELDTSGLDWTQLTNGSELVYADGADSSHSAIVFWEQSAGASASVNVVAISYPSAAPEIDENSDQITVRFPEGVGISFGRSGTGIDQIDELTVGQRRVLQASPTDLEVPAITLVTTAPGTVGTDDWAAYLRRRESNEMQWPVEGGRSESRTALSSLSYESTTVEGDSVSLRFSDSTGGTLDLVVSPSSTTVQGKVYQGLGYHVRVAGIAGATRVELVEPAVAVRGDWVFTQRWGMWSEMEVDLIQRYRIFTSWSGADIQSYYYAGGPSGSRLAYFEQPVGSQITVREIGSRHGLQLAVPIGVATANETPERFWYYSEEPLADKWTSVDEWTAAFDHVGNAYRARLGMGISEPLPTLWLHPTGEDFDRLRTQGSPDSYEDSWLAAQIDDYLDLSADLGFAMLNIDSPWESDMDHLDSEFLPGSGSFGSGAAPWRLEVSPAMGGVQGLRQAVEAIHGAGMKAAIWTTPGHFSNSSSLLVDNPEWIRWRATGVPEDADYGDIVGLDMNGDYYDYAVRQMQAAYDIAGFDGIMTDSFLTFGVYADARDPIPLPQFDRTLAFHKALREMGMTEITNEGCGPLGVSGGGYAGGGYYMDHPQAQAMALSRFDTVNGREYGLYRYGADTIFEIDSYYRMVASKSHIQIDEVTQILRMDAEQRAAMTSAHRDFMTVLPLMQRRQLVVRDNRWVGVQYTNDTTSDVVVFAFEAFSYSPSSSATVTDVTSGSTVEPGQFTTQARHTYRISPE